MAIKFEFVGETSDLSRALRDVVGGMNDVKTKTDAASFSMKEMFKQTAMLAGASLGIAGIKEFATQMVNVRKEMQGFETSFKVLLGNQEKANEVFGALKEYAITTPLMLKDLSASAQTMLGFGISADKVVPLLKQIGDISMGDAQKFSSLSLAFSQMSATGKLMGQDLLQMINAGFNPLAEIARKTGRSIAELKDDMSEGKIGAEMVADAFRTATEEGGQFYGMMDQMGQTISGQLNTLSGAIDDMFGTLAIQNEEIITGSIEAMTTLVKNYETVGKAVATLIATYGTFKAALMVTNAIQLANAAGTTAATTALWAHITATKAGAAAQAMFNTICKANPYVLLATAIVAVTGAIWTFTKKTDEAAEAKKRMDEAIAQNTASLELEKKKIESLKKAIDDETKSINQRRQAIKTLQQIIPDYHAKISEEGKIYDDNRQAIERYLKVKNLELKIEAVNELAKEQIKKKTEAEARKSQLQQDLAPEQKKATEGGITNIFSNIYHGNISQGIQTEIAQADKDIRDAQKALEPYNDALDKLNEELIAINTPEIGKEEEKQNKQYWEGKKKQAKDRLEALSYIEAQGSEGDKIRKEIAEYDKHLAAYETKSGSKNTNDAAKQEQEIANIREKQKRESAMRLAKLDLEIRQATIDSYDEGNKKTIEQLQLNKDKELQAIEEWKEAVKQEKIDAAREIWSADSKNKDKIFENSEEYKNLDTSLSPQEQQYVEERTKAAGATFDRGMQAVTQKQREDMRAYYMEYGNYLEKIMNTTLEYNEKIDKAKKEGNEALAISLQEQFKQALYDIDMEQVGRQMDWLSMFDSASVAFKSMLEKSLKGKKDILEYITGKSQKKPSNVTDETLEKLKNNAEDMLTIYQQVDEQEQKLSSTSFFGVNKVKSTVESLTKAREYDTLAMKEGITEEQKMSLQAMAADQRAQALQNIAGQAVNVTSAISGACKKMKEFAKAIGDTDLEETAEQLSSFAENHEAAAAAWANSGNPWSALVGGLENMLEQFTNNLLSSKTEAAALATYYKDWNQQIKEMAFELDDDKYEGIFENQSIRKGQDAIEKSKRLIVEYRKELDNLHAMTVQTGSAKYFLGIETSGAKYKELMQLTEGKIFDQSGELDVEAAKEFLNTYTLLTTEQRKQIQNAIDLKEQYDELLDTVDGLISENFGSLAGDITNAIFDAVRKGDDFWQSFKESGSSVISELGKQLVQQMYVETYLEGFKDKMRKAYLSDDPARTQKDLANIMTEMFEGFDDVYRYAYEAAEAWDSMAVSKGWEIPDDTSAQASKGVFASASQDSVDEANGRMAAIQIGQQTMIAQGLQLVANGETTNGILSDILAANALRNSYLTDIIDKITRMQTDFGNKLQQINDNTKNI